MDDSMTGHYGLIFFDPDLRQELIRRERKATQLMEDLPISFAVIANDRELRRGVTSEVERTRRIARAWRPSRLLRGWLTRTLRRGLTASVVPGAVTSSTSRPDLHGETSR